MGKDTLIIQPHLCGVNTAHKAGFTIDRECDPYGTCLVLCFRSPANILTVNGLEVADIGDCIIHSPDFRQYHFSMPESSEGYRNDWLHVSPQSISGLMSELSLPYNELISCAIPELLSPYISMIQNELQKTGKYTERLVENHLSGMLLSIAQAYDRFHNIGEEMTNTEREYYIIFNDLRKKALENCFDSFEIKDIAAKANLSPERFTVLYRKFFNVSPYSELIDARLVKVKRLLLGTSMSIAEIAEACNYNNIYYFSRLFKKKTGMSPSRYRKAVGKIDSEKLEIE